MPTAAEIRRRREELGGGPRAGFHAASPSIRSFAQAIARGREAVERIPLLPAGRPDLAGCLRALEDAEAVAVAVTVEPLADLPAFAAAAQGARVPVLRADLLLEEAQVWEARIAGADAVLLHADVLGPSATAQLARAALACHMSPCIACSAQDQVAAAAALRGAVVALAQPGLGLRVPAGVPVLALAEEPGLAGTADALLDPALGAARDPAAQLRRLLT